MPMRAQSPRPSKMWLMRLLLDITRRLDPRTSRVSAIHITRDEHFDVCNSE